MKVWYYDDLERGMRMFVATKAIITGVSLALVMDPSFKPEGLQALLKNQVQRGDRQTFPDEPIELIPERRRGRRRTEKPGPR